jgi:DNA excision repair protein ERCC-4
LYLLSNSRLTFTRLLLTEDAFAFQQYLEGLIDANTTNEAGNARQNQSPWMLTEAANIIFQYAKRRCYTIAQKSKRPVQEAADEHEDEWEAVRELEGVAVKKSEWPEGMQPVLEELPKWSLVAAAMQEIEEEMIRRETKLTARKSLPLDQIRYLTLMNRRPWHEHGASYDILYPLS